MPGFSTVFFYGDTALGKGVPSAFRSVPFIVTESGQPEFRFNEYFLARRNGDWAGLSRPAGLYSEVTGQRALRAKPNYLRNRAYHLDTFRRWAVGEGIDSVKVTEKELDDYAEQLEEGLVTDHEGGILPQSVNQHLTSIVDYLAFGVSRSWRRALGLTVARRSRSGGYREAKLLIMRRANPAELDVWYTEADIQRFFGEFETAPAKLAAQLMYATGLRIFEALNLRVSQIPTVEEFRADKAKRFLSVVGKFGKRRRVPLSEEIVAALQKFITFDRAIYAKRLEEPTDLVFIGDGPNNSAAPLKPRFLQKQFVVARTAAKTSRLTPHLLRHHYAAHYLLRAWRSKLAVLTQHEIFEVGAAQAALSIELLVLKESLGHSSLDTTSRYLVALGFFVNGQLSDDYADALGAH